MYWYSFADSQVDAAWLWQGFNPANFQRMVELLVIWQCQRCIKHEEYVVLVLTYRWWLVHSAPLWWGRSGIEVPNLNLGDCVIFSIVLFIVLARRILTCHIFVSTPSAAVLTLPYFGVLVYGVVQSLYRDYNSDWTDKWIGCSIFVSLEVDKLCIWLLRY